MRAPASQPALYIAQIETHVARMPSLSTTATKVLEMCNNPHATPNDLNRLIALDPVMAGQVLRLVNSAYYSLKTPVSSLTRAIILLGMNTVKNMVLSFAILDRLQIPKPFRTLSGATFWSHSVAVGVIAKYLAERMGVDFADQEDYFVCGLMHDLGKVPLYQQFGDYYDRAQALARGHGWSMAYAERVIFGIDHNMVGDRVARKWRLSPAFVEVLANHHRPDRCLTAGALPMTIIALANLYAQLLESNSIDDVLPAGEFATALMATIGLDAFKLNGMHQTVCAEIEKAQIFLEISQKDAHHDR